MFNRLPRVIVIAHRGASGERPEHTIESYQLAIDQGADYIEPDLVMTRDGVLVARHENEIGGTTDVAEHPEFAARRRSQVVDGEPVTGWFTEDFTLAEIKTLRARERLPDLRPANRAFDGRFSVPTFEEIMQLVRDVNRRRSGGLKIGVYPETKHPAHFAGLDLPQEAAVLQTLQAFGYAGEGSPVFIQSFDPHNLRQLRDMTRLPLVQLLEHEIGDLDRDGAIRRCRSASRNRWQAPMRWLERTRSSSPFTSGRFAPKTSFCPPISGPERPLRRTATCPRKSSAIWRGASTGFSRIFPRSACASETRRHPGVRRPEPHRGRPAEADYISAVHREHQPLAATNLPGNRPHGR